MAQAPDELVKLQARLLKELEEKNQLLMDMLKLKDQLSEKDKELDMFRKQRRRRERSVSSSPSRSIHPFPKKFKSAKSDFDTNSNSVIDSVSGTASNPVIDTLSSSIENINIENDDYLRPSDDFLPPEGSIEKRKEEVLQEEMKEKIDKYEFSSPPPTELGCIMIKPPEDEDSFLKILEEDRKKHSQKVVMDQEEVYVNYWDNFITSAEDITTRLDWIMESEKKKKNVVKISITFGRIVERYDKEQEVYSYSVFNPNDTDSTNLLPVDLTNNNSREEYKKKVIADLCEMNEKSHVIDSSTMYIAIHKIQVDCFIVLMLVGRGMLLLKNWLIHILLSGMVVRETYVGFLFQSFTSIIRMILKGRGLTQMFLLQR
jgi:hypothetical protein